jgi:hypothetical protein
VLSASVELLGWVYGGGGALLKVRDTSEDKIVYNSSFFACFPFLKD